ncbi:50S ribosomal protein L1 [Candidatus Saccharibacteria bacterium]|nr:50S ribosomal protein L1 [Candidatus Saccharibacteria bacterium]
MAKKDAKDEKLVAADAADIEEKTTEEAAKAPAVVETKTDEAPAVEEKFAKAGKKSKKHIEEVRAEEERQARKLEAAAEPEKKVGPRPVTRSRLERRGKNYRKVSEKIEKGKAYSLSDALKLAIETSPVKFDATLEMHFRLGVDPRQADQNIRATVTLPAGTGKDVRVAVFAPLDVCKAAKAAGADIAEDEEFTAKLDKEQLDFDVLISTPQYMPKLGKYARLLGPKGLMPNPKAGTVTTDIEKAVKEAKAGKIEYRVDKQAIVHVGLGKLSFGADKLMENVNAFVDSLKSQKPASIKGQYVKSVYISTTMGPSILVENLFN